MPHIRGIKDEAVDVYCEPLITKEMGYHRLSHRVNKMMPLTSNYNSSISVLSHPIYSWVKILNFYFFIFVIILFTLN